MKITNIKEEREKVKRGETVGDEIDQRIRDRQTENKRQRATKRERHTDRQ